MNKYPYILFLHNDSSIETFFQENREKLECSLFFVHSTEELNKLFNPSYQLLVTYGADESVFQCNSVITPRMRTRWIHFTNIPDIPTFNKSVNYCFIHNCSIERIKVRPTFSIFVPCYNSYHKVLRVRDSIKTQTFQDYEIVLLDDSSDENHFPFLKEAFAGDSRVRLYKRDSNSGNIGNVKNEAVSLCRGQYILELDSDDEILPHVLMDSVKYFSENLDVGFVYMDFINIYENGSNFRYSDFICKGYGSYYSQKYKDRWVYVYNTPQINNITLSHLVCCPNHPRIWKTNILLEAGNYSEFLPICDDYEILLRTAAITKMAKLFTFGYIQYMNDNGNNFSFIRNAEINRIGPRYIQPILYKSLGIHERMKELGGYEDPKYMYEHSPLWTRKDYTPQFANKITTKYKKQICIIGRHNLKFVDTINPDYDYLLLDSCPIEELWNLLDSKNLNIKCYSLPNFKDLKPFFLTMYRCTDFEIIDRKEKIMITGTGRCGTTFLMILFSLLNFDTGFNEDNFKDYIKGECNSGLEKDYTSDVQVIKSPYYLSYIDKIIKDPNCVIKNVIIPIRDFTEAAKSREKNGNQFGGLWNAKNEEEQVKYYNDLMSNYIQIMTKHDLNTTFIDFERMVENKEYLFNKLNLDVSFDLFSEKYNSATLLSKKNNNTSHDCRSSIINEHISPESKYLEIGVEYLTTFENVKCLHKTGVDPDPKKTNEFIIKKTSDDFFKTNVELFNVVFIDGMHQVEYLVRDINNSIAHLHTNGILFIDDIIPIKESEQLKVPTKHKYENGILKYLEPWTGDVWKVVYHLLLHFRSKFDFSYYTHANYRGVGMFRIKEMFQIPDHSIDIINGYQFSNFHTYLNIL